MLRILHIQGGPSGYGLLFADMRLEVAPWDMNFTLRLHMWQLRNSCQQMVVHDRMDLLVQSCKIILGEGYENAFFCNSAVCPTEEADGICIP